MTSPRRAERGGHLSIVAASGGMVALLTLLLPMPADRVPSHVGVEVGLTAQGRLAAPPAGSVSPSDSDEFVGPFASWSNLRSAFGAKGDGASDDTSAFQAALDRLGASETDSPVLFVPRGTYRITRTLTLAGRLGVSIVGEDPDETRVVWAGTAGGTMLSVNGIAYSRIDRLTFDGRRMAAVAVEQAWDGSRQHFDTGNQYADDRFVDVGFGIRGGYSDHGFAETSILRAKFIRNTKAGVALGNFNALDAWIRYSLFEDCATGVTNYPGAGNYRVYDSVFRRSTIADLMMQNTGGFTARGNYSQGSKAFWLSGSSINHPATIDIQQNTIIDPASEPVIRLGNQGPGLVMDNTIRARPGASGPLVAWTSLYGSDLISIGNAYSVARGTFANGRLITLDDRLVSRDSIPAVEPVLPAVPPNRSRKVIDVARGSSGAAIQQAIDRALQEGGPRPVVHLPFGSYDIARTLTVPPSNLQIVGDGPSTVLKWSSEGADPVIALGGATRAALRDLRIDGSRTADGLVAADADKPGGRIYMEGVQVGSALKYSLEVEGLERTTTHLVDFGHSESPSATSVRVSGRVATAQPGSNRPRSAEGRTIIHSGSSSGNRLSYDIGPGGALLARDIWYEGPSEGGFALVHGRASFAMQGSRVSTPAGRTPAALTFRDFSGRALLLTTLYDDRVVVTGDSQGGSILGLANLREAQTFPPFTDDSRIPARTLILNMRQRVAPAGPVPRNTVAVTDVGTFDADFLRRMLSDVREVPEPRLDPVPPGATDLRLFRIWVGNCVRNISLRGSPASN